ncbi:MAG: hypothetical protein ACREAG_07585 [Nitrosopumilaceae archaeon]
MGGQFNPGLNPGFNPGPSFQPFPQPDSDIPGGKFSSLEDPDPFGDFIRPSFRQQGNVILPNEDGSFIRPRFRQQGNVIRPDELGLRPTARGPVFPEEFGPRPEGAGPRPLTRAAFNPRDPRFQPGQRPRSLRF